MDPYRLPTNVIPRHYDLSLRPDLDQATFTGTVEINLEATAESAQIVLNAIELEITEAVLDGTPVPASAIGLDDELERLTLDVQLGAGDHTLRLEFNGILNDKLRGFYCSTWTDDDGTEHVLATTQFESTNARRCFPCWDEPAFKATFAATLDVPAELMAVSCQSEVSAQPIDSGRKRVRFATTPIMSTYLLAFVVGNLEATDPVDVDGIPMRIVHTPGKGPQTAFALDAGVFALRWLTDYFGIRYPGDKLDMIAIPDFAFGAMENLGCVTYREILLVVDPDTTTQPEQQRSVDVIAHELAHMWFGDLVTMQWWEGLWLKEAFATFMEMKVTDAYRPEWNRWVDFGLSRTAAFDVDSLNSTRPIEFEVISPADAEGMYDLLTYEKGAAVVRMLEQYLGEDEFREGSRTYLNRHAFANTETHDLWDALEDSSQQPTRSIMDSWIFQGGFPVVEATRDGDLVTLHQQRFSYTPVADGATPLWQVPAVITRGHGTERHTQRIVIDAEQTTVTLDGPADWFVVNTNGSGFYRCSYDPASRDAILANLSSLSPIERYGLLDDAWAMVTAGRIGLDDFATIARHYRSDNDVAVWRRLVGALGTLNHLATGNDRAAVAAFARELCADKLSELGLRSRSDEDPLDAELRALLYRAAGTVGADAAVVADASAIDRLDAEAADASLRAAAVTVLAATGDTARFEEFRKRFANATSPQDERRYMNSLAEFPGRAEIEALLPMTLDGTIRTQDAPYLLGAALTHREHGSIVWDFVTERWDEIVATYPQNSIPRLLTGVRALSEAGQAEAVNTFLDQHPVQQGTKTVDQHLERLQINVAMRARLANAMTAALR